jgi:OmpA-like transmembrane domain
LNSTPKTRRAALFTLFLACSAAALPARSAELGFYVGGTYGTASKDSSIEQFDALNQAWYNFFGYTPATITRKLDDKSNTYGFVAGYRLLPNLAFEGGYLDLGSTKYRSQSSGDFGGEPANLNLNLDAKSAGIALSALGILPISYSFELYARGGVVFATNTVHTFAYNETGNETHEGSKSSTNLLAGVGASLTFLEIYGARLEYVRVFDVGEEFTGKGDVDMITLGITVGF